MISFWHVSVRFASRACREESLDHLVIRFGRHDVLLEEIMSSNQVISADCRIHPFRPDCIGVVGLEMVLVCTVAGMKKHPARMRGVSVRSMLGDCSAASATDGEATHSEKCKHAWSRNEVAVHPVD